MNLRKLSEWAEDATSVRTNEEMLEGLHREEHVCIAACRADVESSLSCVGTYKRAFDGNARAK